MTPHFSDAEFACRCSCGLLPPQDFQDRLELLRVVFDAPLRVSSGARCPSHNQAVSTTGLNGPHTVAAVDFRVAGTEAYRLLKLALEHGFQGIGIHQRAARGGRFIHLDDRRAHPGPALWSY